ncbi:MAG: protein-L-isoaspartate O-methyltransferase [Candidatus Pacebacteria bacterium]|nr:protein-L-isoaspartate O-methyltransferase [Candidatus Paceibacterota bacterium]
MQQLIKDLIEKKYLITPNIIDAFVSIDRIDFVPENLKNQAYYDIPLPIGYGQTISQPRTVAFMLELLKPTEGDIILDIGSGSGWQSSLLAHIDGDSGKVFAIEIVSELSEFGQNNSKKYKFNNLKFIVGDGSRGLEKEAPFDKIIIAASAFKKIPEELYKQLKIGGRLVTPVDNSIWLVIKRSNDKLEKQEFPGFVFVPLIEREE